jgi:hypothetical protein
MKHNPILPKHPMSPFLWWRHKNRDRLQEEAQAGNIDYNAHVSAQWKALEDKTELVELAKWDSLDYKRKKKLAKCDEGKKTWKVSRIYAVL